MFRLALGLAVWASQASAATTDSFVWTESDRWFGGFSAIEVGDDGEAFVALSDRAVLVRGRFVRDAAGRIAEVVTESHERLRDAEGKPLRGRMADSEGLALAPDGRLYVLERAVAGLGFMSRVRVFGLDGGGGATVFESRAGLHDNLEGLSVRAEGGGIVMTMISDDNFRFFQRTEIVEVHLPD